MMTTGENPIPERSPVTGHLAIAQPDGHLQKYNKKQKQSRTSKAKSGTHSFPEAKLRKQGASARFRSLFTYPLQRGLDPGSSPE
nr:hypothetical protein [uncultured Roseibium sp.]